MISEPTLQALVDGMGDTSKEVAKLLRSNCITGRKKSALQCPVAEHMKRQTGCKDVAVTRNNVVLYEGIGNVNESRPVIVKTTTAISNFVADFDTGLYPDLVI